VAPWLVTRGDTGKYAFGALLLRNIQIGKWGAAFNRPGTELVGEVADSDKKTRLVPWIFDDDDRYALQLGDGTLRFHQQGSTVLAGTVAAYNAATLYAIGDLAANGGVNYYAAVPNTAQAPPYNTWRVEFTGLLALANQPAMTITSLLTGGGTYAVATLQGGSATKNEIQTISPSGVVTGGTFTITWNAQTTASLAWNATAAQVQAALEALSNIAVGDVTVTLSSIWHAMPLGLLELPTPWDQDHVFTTRFVQSFDFMWWTNREVPITVLKRFSNTDWTIEPEDFLPGMLAPFGVVMSGGGATGGAQTFRYVVIAVKAGDDQIESLPADSAGYFTGTLDNSGAGGTIQVTSAGHGLTGAQSIFVKDVFPTTGAFNQAFEDKLTGLISIVGATTAGTFDIAGTAGITVPPGYSATVLGVGLTVDTSPWFNDAASTVGTVDDDGQFTAAAHGLTTGDWIVLLVAQVTTPAATKALIGKQFRVTVLTADVFTLDDSKGLAWGPDVGIIWFARAEVRTTNGKTLLPGGSHLTLTWNAVAGAAHYWIFKRDDSGAFGYIAQTDVPTWEDDGSLDGTIDPTDGPPRPLNPFRGVGDFPQACGLFGARLWFGGTDNDPSKARGSRVNDLLNFTVHSPIEDDDSIGAPIGISDTRDIRHFAAMDALSLFTGGRKIVFAGDGNGTVTPALVGAKPLGGVGGSSHVPPLVIDGDALFIEARQSIVRRFRLDLVSGQKGADLTAYAPHLFQGHSIVDWCWQSMPQPTVWIVREDGIIITMAYVPEQEIIACCRHVTGDGIDFGYESVCCIPDDETDDDGNVTYRAERVYAIVRRTVNGSSKRFVERFALRKEGDDDYDLVDDAWFLDCAAKYDGRNTSATTLTLSGGPPWAAGTLGLALTASVATFAGTGADVGKKYRLHSGTDFVDVEVTLQNTTTDCTVKLTTPAPPSLRATPTAVWSLLASTVTGLSHLEARTVALLGDGVRLVDKVVSGGAAVVSTPSEVVLAGLSYLSQIKTLPPTSASPSGGLEDAAKLAGHATLDVTNTVSNRTQGLRVGTSEDGELRPLNAELADDDVTALLSGKIAADIGGELKRDAGIFIQMADPLPMIVNGFIIDYEMEASPG
jgi:hypothetical protein